MDVYGRRRDHEEQLQRECVNRMKRSLNSRIQDSVYPYWRAHASLNGWSSMNYPSVLGNARKLITPEKPREGMGRFSNLLPPLSSPSTRKRRPISNETGAKALRLSNDPAYAESFLSKVGRMHWNDLVKEHREVLEDNKRFNPKFKCSAGVISTATYEERKEAIELLNKSAENYAPLKPISATLGPKVDPLNARKVKQLDEIEFENDESEEDEDTYEFKVTLNALVETTEDEPDSVVD